MTVAAKASMPAESSMVEVNGMLVEKNMQGENAMGVAAGLAMALMTTA